MAASQLTDVNLQHPLVRHAGALVTAVVDWAQAQEKPRQAAIADAENELAGYQAELTALRAELETLRRDLVFGGVDRKELLKVRKKILDTEQLFADLQAGVATARRACDQRIGKTATDAVTGVRTAAFQVRELRGSAMGNIESDRRVPSHVLVQCQAEMSQVIDKIDVTLAAIKAVGPVPDEIATEAAALKKTCGLVTAELNISSDYTL